MDHVVGGGQIEPRAARLQREHEHRRAVIGLEALHHLIPGALGRAAVQEQDLAAETLLQVGAQPVPELGELGEAECAIALDERFGENLIQARELARAPG